MARHVDEQVELLRCEADLLSACDHAVAVEIDPEIAGIERGDLGLAADATQRLSRAPRPWFALRLSPTTR
jgi:hypothetical protein